MNKASFKAEVVAILGSSNIITQNAAGMKLVGVAHIINGNDAEYTDSVGTTITDARVDELFTWDYDNTVQFCIDQYTSFTTRPQTVKHALARLVAMFNYITLYNMSDLTTAINADDYSAAADAVENANFNGLYTSEVATVVTDLRNAS